MSLPYRDGLKIIIERQEGGNFLYRAICDERASPWRATEADAVLALLHVLPGVTIEHAH